MNMSRIVLSAKVRINCSEAVLFACVSNPVMDAHWRKEIQRCDVSVPCAAGVEYVQYSNLSKRLSIFAQRFVCTHFEPHKGVVFETMPQALFYQRSERNVRRKDEGCVEFDYRLEFDSAIAAAALGFPLPLFLIRWAAQRDAHQYLKALKVHLEKAE